MRLAVSHPVPGSRPARGRAAFTMIEIALCLAIIGFALVSILLVLPWGMNSQRDTREETVINEDMSVLLEAIRNGARGMDDLTNYVYAITNNQTFYNANGTLAGTHTWGYTYDSASDNGIETASMHLTNGLRIVGLLSTPEFTAGNVNSGGLPLASTFQVPYTSNHVVAYVRSMSGLAAEKPPQNNSIMQEDTFSYRVLCVNAPVPMDTNAAAFPLDPRYRYTQFLANNQRELRLLFMWPQLPSGNVGAGRQTFRTTITGQLILTNYSLAIPQIYPNIYPLYFYQTQSYSTNTP